MLGQRERLAQLDPARLGRHQIGISAAGLHRDIQTPRAPVQRFRLVKTDDEMPARCSLPVGVDGNQTVEILPDVLAGESEIPVQPIRRHPIDERQTDRPAHRRLQPEVGDKLFPLGPGHQRGVLGHGARGPDHVLAQFQLTPERQRAFTQEHAELVVPRGLDPCDLLTPRPRREQQERTHHHNRDAPAEPEIRPVLAQHFPRCFSARHRSLPPRNI